MRSTGTLEGRRNKMRIGTGYDVHRLTENRALILGGVAVPYEKGLLGHSDADVLVHAIMDALLGAAALGDIGKHFPDSEERYRGISSIALLKEVKKLLDEELYLVGNIDATIIAQRPKLAAYLPEMRETIAKTLEIDISQVNIKATTEEGLGFTGAGEGIAAQAVCLLENIRDFSFGGNQNVYAYEAGTEAGTACAHCTGCHKGAGSI